MVVEEALVGTSGHCSVPTSDKHCSSATEINIDLSSLLLTLLHIAFFSFSLLFSVYLLSVISAL